MTARPRQSPPDADAPPAVVAWWPQLPVPYDGRLQEISEADAIAEGLKWIGDDCGFWTIDGQKPGADDPRALYAKLWDAINGSGAWASNPWVWVVEFRRLP